MSGGEGPWCGDAATLKLTTPGLLIAGLNPVAHRRCRHGGDGIRRSARSAWREAFHICDNHLALAEEAGLGSADLGQIDVRGLTIAQARYPYG